CSLVVLYFRSGARMESAYGLAITITMLMTTLLISVYLRRVRRKTALSMLVLVAFGLLVLILLFRPTGLLGKPEVEKV
ncbi:MAG: KUP/HAK/KT family potassium transporter, partial [Rhodocyclaceae bacterium]|nr:KUP/HAK/KT family potassium transporter [Rhodocyclaceae bacterium]